MKNGPNDIINHPALKLWHIDNELGCSVPECFCDNSTNAFREWLKKRYGSLDNLNEAWGTTFWSQQYSDWDEIHPPRNAPTFINPGQQLDWQRFNSDTWVEQFNTQKSYSATVFAKYSRSHKFYGVF